MVSLLHSLVPPISPRSAFSLLDEISFLFPSSVPSLLPNFLSQVAPRSLCLLHPSFSPLSFPPFFLFFHSFFLGCSSHSDISLYSILPYLLLFLLFILFPLSFHVSFLLQHLPPFFPFLTFLLHHFLAFSFYLTFLLLLALLSLLAPSISPPPRVSPATGLLSAVRWPGVSVSPYHGSALREEKICQEQLWGGERWSEEVLGDVRRPPLGGGKRQQSVRRRKEADSKMTGGGGGEGRKRPGPPLPSPLLTLLLLYLSPSVFSSPLFSAFLFLNSPFLVQSSFFILLSFYLTPSLLHFFSFTQFLVSSFIPSLLFSSLLISCLHDLLSFSLHPPSLHSFFSSFSFSFSFPQSSHEGCWASLLPDSSPRQQASRSSPFVIIIIIIITELMMLTHNS